MVNRRFDIWLPGFFTGALDRAAAHRQRHGQLTHILFLVCDHYEPRHGATEPDQPSRRVATWHREYAGMQAELRTRYGKSPVHSFFYPPHHGYEHLPRLAEMAYDGLGEVELHYHHRDDTPDSLRRALNESIAAYNAHGLLLESGSPPRTGFGFVHGDWALNNSCNGQYCGVNDEISILQDLGCWADFTLPSGNKCQTRKINSIYYGVGDPDRPKAHDRGPDARVGAMPPAGLMLIQGPLAINWSAPGHPRPENASLTTHNWGRPDRIPVWLNANVHVKGRPEWLFVKLHTHGAIEKDFDALFGEKARALHKVLNEQYDNGREYRLHYVTARQAYNIAKAAEAGLSGDPSQYVDHVIAPPTTQHYALNVRHEVSCCTTRRVTLRASSPHAGARLRTRVGPWTCIEGEFSAVDIDAISGTAVLTTPREGIVLTLHGGPEADRVSLSGATWGPDSGTSGARSIRVGSSSQCTVQFTPAAALSA